MMSTRKISCVNSLKDHYNKVQIKTTHDGYIENEVITSSSISTAII